MAHLIAGNWDIVLPLCLVAVLSESTCVQQVLPECPLCVRCCVLCHSESDGLANSPEMGGAPARRLLWKLGPKSRDAVSVLLPSLSQVKSCPRRSEESPSSSLS